MDNKQHKFIILGARPQDRNRGVTALMEGVVRSILEYSHNPDILIHTYKSRQIDMIDFGGREYSIHSLDIVPGVNFLRKNNLYHLYLLILLSNLFPFRFFKNFLQSYNHRFAEIVRADYVLDITGGDSFSDIYGMKRMMQDFMYKYLFIFADKEFVFMPQTYGPFHSEAARRMARYILSRSRTVFSRDQAGLHVAGELVCNRTDTPQVNYSPDVAFVLKPQKVNSEIVTSLQSCRDNGKIIVGLNVSGLLYGGEAKKRFSLKSEYKEIIDETIRYFLGEKDTVLLLIPHVFTPGNEVDDDYAVCNQIFDEVKHHERTILVNEEYSHRELKYLIGMTDFFVGARMHSCIAAISQCIPTVGYAYSGKFYGVFESAGIEDLVVDLRNNDTGKIISALDKFYCNRPKLKNRQLESVPPTIELALRLFSKV